MSGINYNHEVRAHIINYYFTYPGERSEWQFGIQRTNGKLVGFILGIPRHIYTEIETITCMYIEVKCSNKYMHKQLRSILIKELVRRANLAKINQFIYWVTVPCSSR